MKLVLVPAGEFWRGSADGDEQGEPDERPRRKLRISRPFYIGAYEVTQEEYERVMGENPSWFCPSGPGRDRVAEADTRRHPVDMVSWDDAVEFCRRLSQLPEEKGDSRVYRLPTEAEWEYAARGGTTTRYCTGDTITARDANVNEGPRTLDSRLHGMTRPVGSYKPNAFGLHDVHGNVWEWCADWYAADYYEHAPAADPTGPATGTGRVVRGGEWSHAARYCRSANRDFTRATRRDLGNGIRVVCEHQE